MAIQTTYPLRRTLAFEGQAGDGSNDVFVWSATNVAADSFFGRVCLAVAAEADEFVQPTGTAGVFMGILQHTHAVEQADLTLATAGLPQNQPGNVMRRGRIWVVAETVISDVTAGVFYDHANPAGDPEFFGRLTTQDDADTTAIPQVKWLGTTAAVGELVLVEINFP